MEISRKAANPPDHVAGIRKDFEEETTCDTIEDAEELFVLAKDRLLNINEWHEITTSIKTKFHIVDKRGHALQRRAHKGDFIVINIPAPGIQAGDGLDWVIVDAIEYDDYPDENREIVAMRLRPVSNPMNHDESIAHFFTNEATSTFVIERNHKKVIARYFGRNEHANTQAENITDAVRNAAVAFSAMLGFSDVQWKGLLKGFIK